MHAVKDGKRKSNIHDSSPHVEFVEFGFSGVVELRTSAKRWHDPQLTEERNTKTGYLIVDF